MAVNSWCRRLGLDRLVRRVSRAGGLAGGSADRRAGGRVVEPRCHVLSGQSWRRVMGSPLVAHVVIRRTFPVASSAASVHRGRGGHVAAAGVCRLLDCCAIVRGASRSEAVAVGKGRSLVGYHSGLPVPLPSVTCIRRRPPCPHPKARLSLLLRRAYALARHRRRAARVSARQPSRPSHAPRPCIRRGAATTTWARHLVPPRPTARRERLVVPPRPLTKHTLPSGPAGTGATVPAPAHAHACHGRVGACRKDAAGASTLAAAWARPPSSAFIHSYDRLTAARSMRRDDCAREPERGLEYR